MTNEYVSNKSAVKRIFIIHYKCIIYDMGVFPIKNTKSFDKRIVPVQI